MKKKLLKIMLSAALAVSAVTAIPQSITADAWTSAGAYKVRQYFYIPWASESTYYFHGKNYNQGEIVIIDSSGFDQYGIHLVSRGYLTDYYFYKLY